MENTIVNDNIKIIIRLNPYYNGRYSWRLFIRSNKCFTFVLILIIMEDTHGG